MQTIQVNVLNPKAYKLLQDLAELELISLEENNNDSFLKTVAELREKASTYPISLEEITKEAELVRSNRYANKQG